MDDVLIATLWSDARSTSSPWHPKYLELKSLVAQYADQAVEEATAELRTRLDTAHKDYVEEIADLREQLDRALVPKYSIGQHVMSSKTGPEIIKGVYVAYEVEGSGEIRYREDYFAPLETECQHETHRWLDPNGDGFLARKVPNNNCPLCGESLTKEGEA